MDTRERAAILLVLVVALILIGTVGFMILEGMDFLDAFFMTMITVSTVGYGFVGRGDFTEMGKVFTVIVILFGIGIVAYAFQTLTGMVLEGNLSELIRRRRMERKIEKIKNHYIVCGLGQTGRSIAHELQTIKAPYVVVDKDEESLKRYAEQVDKEVFYVVGDATDDSVLEQARIAEAKGIFASLDSDVDNLYIVITAREKRPDLRIVARARNEVVTHKMKKAGADSVVTPNEIGGVRMATLMLNPEVLTFLDVMTQDLGEVMRLDMVRIKEGSELAGNTLRNAQLPQRTGLIVIALRSSLEGRLLYNPGSNTTMAVGDSLIVLGQPDQVEKLRKLAGEAKEREESGKA